MYEGLSPLWKESLDLPFMPPMADFSPANLAQVCGFMALWLRGPVALSRCTALLPKVTALAFDSVAS